MAKSLLKVLYLGLMSKYMCAGMMGSGKSTVGKILAEVLGYSFFDRFVFSHESTNSSLQKES